MRPKMARRLRLFLATATVGICAQAIAPQGCIGVLQQNLEAAFATQAVVGPELYQSWIYNILKNW